MKRLVFALSLFALVLPLAARANTWASTTPGITDIGDTAAYASNNLPEGFLEAEAEFRGLDGLAARAEVTLGAPFFGQRNALAHAEYTQEFLVTAAGPATINWFVQGFLRASAIDASAVYQVNSSFNVYADAYFLGSIAAVADLLSSADPTGTVPISEAGSATYNFADFQVGRTFKVTARLETVVSSNNFVATGAAPALSIESNFFDTAGISSVSGGILAVPEPGSGLLLASGIALLGIRRLRARC